MSTKRISINIVVAFLAFLIGLFSSRMNQSISHPIITAPPTQPVCEMPSDLQPILNVHFCDLVADPERYDERIVRFDAFMLADSRYEPMNDHVYLGEPRCPTTNLWVNEGFHLTSRTCPALLAKLDALLMRYDPAYPGKNAKVRVVGLFSSPKETPGQGRWQSERFTIISVERVASIDEDN